MPRYRFSGRPVAGSFPVTDQNGVLVAKIGKLPGLSSFTVSTEEDGIVATGRYNSLLKRGQQLVGTAGQTILSIEYSWFNKATLTRADGSTFAVQMSAGGEWKIVGQGGEVVVTVKRYLPWWRLRPEAVVVEDKNGRFELVELVGAVELYKRNARTTRRLASSPT